MQYIYGALLLHAAKQPITEDSLKKVVAATGAKPDEAMVKAVTASLEGVNIEEAIKAAAAPATVAAAPAAAAPAKEEKKEEDEAKKAEEAAAGLSSLFG